MGILKGYYVKKKMFYGASWLLFERAKKLRENMTGAEVVLWEYLRQHPLGYKFRRQHPVGIYIVDFYCHKLKLVKEVDGSIHGEPEVRDADIERQRQLELDGLKVMRFTNEEVLKKKEIVIEEIHLLINERAKL
jgi:imidazole glycerol-phosphate synthase subunit HisF